MEPAQAQVRLRPLRECDTGEWLALLNDPSVMRGMDRAAKVSETEHRAFVRSTVDPHPERWSVIESLATGRLVGGIWLWDLHDRHLRAEVRLFVDPARARRHIGTEAIALCAGRAFGTLGLHKLYAYVHVDNVGSARAFENAGFYREAVLKEEALRDGTFTDVVRYAKINRRP